MKMQWLLAAGTVLAVAGRPLAEGPRAAAQGPQKTWAERLGWPAGQRVVILHADDVGMCCEANQAAQRALTQGNYRSASAMVPCPWFNEMAAWCVAHPQYDVGLHLTLTSEWKYYRWGPVAPPDRVKGLLDSQGYLHASVLGVALAAKAEEVATEIRAQLARARQRGMQPSHLDTHMGTLYARPDYTRAYLQLAVDEHIPAMVIEMTPRTIEKFKKQGYPITEASLKVLAGYTLPKLDDFHAVVEGKTYEDKRQRFCEQLRLFHPGLNEIIFHPSVETDCLKKITNSWQQRVWEDRLFADPVIQRFIKENDIVVTDWKEVMARFEKMSAASPAATNGKWPAWRGPDGQGHTPDKNLPTQWSRTANVRWKTPLPDDGNSSPIVWGDRVFLTQATEKVDWPPKPPSGGPASARRRSVLCFDRSNGKLLWQRDTLYEAKESTHSTNPFCSASPVTDGERVIASLGSAGLVCYDFAGKELWRKDLGKLEHIWGNASSPILYGDLAILWCGPGERQFLLAVNKSTGETVWEHREPGGASGKDGKWLGSWSTPLVVRVGDHDEMVLGVPEKVKGFDPKTGKELWSCAGLGKLVYTSPVCSADGVVVALAGYGGPALAVRAGGKGDVTSTHRLWLHAEKHPQRIGSPVIVGEHVYLLNDNGTAQCLDVKTGRDLWGKKRVTSASTWGSMVAAGDRLYVTTRTGDTFVLAAAPKFEQLGKNSLDEPVYASMAVADGELFLRSYKHLWCIGDKK